MRELHFKRVHFFDEECTKFSHMDEWGINLKSGIVFTGPRENNKAIYHKDIQYTGEKIKDKKLYESDIIEFTYKDEQEETGFGKCKGIIEFENGCFIVKEIGFKYNYSTNYPMTLHEWLTDDLCELIGSKFENPELLNEI